MRPPSETPTEAPTPTASPGPLRFAPTATPDTTWDAVKAELEAANMLGNVPMGQAKGDAFYGLIAACGPATRMRDSIIQMVWLPSLGGHLQLHRFDHSTGWWYAWYPSAERGDAATLTFVLHEVGMVAWHGWQHDVEWRIDVRQSFEHLWKTVASGYVAADCAVYQEQ